jgi:MoxR-like ATPase
MNINQKLKKLGEHLETGLVGRRDHARMLLLAAVAGENAILFGPPGTAKSLLARRLKDCFADDIKYFECLLTKFSMPEEVFGPVSLKGLEQDIFRRVYDRYMPGAGIAFIDETFKANSAILNSMLTILNEREFDTGNERIKVTLRCVVGASNEMPKESELQALYDRFIVRMRVNQIENDKDLDAYLKTNHEYILPEKSLRLTKNDLDEITNLSKKISVDDALINLLKDLRTWCLENKIFISDRRLGKIKRLIQVAAVTSGRQSAGVVDSWAIRHCAWDDFTTKQIDELSEWLDGRINKQQHDLVGLKAHVEQEKISCLSKTRINIKNTKGDLIYIDKDGNDTTHKTETFYKIEKKLLTAEEIKNFLKEKFSVHGSGKDTQIHVDYNWVNLNDYLSKNYKAEKIENKPKTVHGVYTHEQRQRFKQGPVDIRSDLENKIKEINEQISILQKSLDDSPWTPKSYQESFVTGLKANLLELDQLNLELGAIIKEYDDLLITTDKEKLTDPSA